MGSVLMLKPNFWLDGNWWCYRVTFDGVLICEGKSLSWRESVIACYKSASRFLQHENLLSESALEQLNLHIEHLEKVLPHE